MKVNLLEERLNQILTNHKFGTQNKSLNSFVNKDTGIFIADYFLVLELESIDLVELAKKHNEAKAKLDKMKETKAKQVGEEDMDLLVKKSLSAKERLEQDKENGESKLQYFSVYVWIINLRAGQFTLGDADIAIRIPVNIRAYSTFYSDSIDQGDDFLKNVIGLQNQNGESSIQIINGRVDEYQIAIHTEKKIFVGHLDQILNRKITAQDSLTVYPLQLLALKHSPSILAVKYHKLSPHHLAVLYDDQYFVVFNLQSSLSYFETQYNLADIPRYGREEQEHLLQDQSTEKFIDFEFGGNGDFSQQASANSNEQTTVDFDFITVYFLTEAGYIYYQSPFLIKDMRIPRNQMAELREYLHNEIDLVERHEKTPQKIDLLRSYLGLLDEIENRDLIKDCNQPIQVKRTFTTSQKMDQTSEVPILNTISQRDLSEMGYEILLQYINTEKTEEQDENNQGGQFNQSNFKTSQQHLKVNSLTTKLLEKKKHLKSKYCKFHKVETKGSLHMFILVKQIGNKTYSAIHSRFSPLPVMPTHILQDYYQFDLIEGEKAHLKNPIGTDIDYLSTSSNKQFYDLKYNSYAKLCSSSISTESLNKVCFSLLNRVYTINFKWIQTLILTNLSNPSIFNEKDQYKSEVKVIVDSKNETKQTIEQTKIIDLAFYTLLEKDGMLLAITPSQNLPFRIKCFTLEYFSNYMSIQRSAKLLNEKLNNLVQAQLIAPLQNQAAPQQNSSKDFILSENPADIKNIYVKESLEMTEKDWEEKIKQHEQNLKKNIQLIKQRYEQVQKKQGELEQKKAQAEKQIHDIIQEKQEQLKSKRKTIEQKNKQIMEKINDITKIMNDPNNKDKLNKLDEGIHPAIGEQYFKEFQIQNEKIKSLTMDYQNYLNKKVELLTSIGYPQKFELKDEEARSIEDARRRIAKNLQIFDNEISQLDSQPQQQK